MFVEIDMIKNIHMYINNKNINLTNKWISKIENKDGYRMDVRGYKVEVYVNRRG
jgi:hypothetical protein